MPTLGNRFMPDLNDWRQWGYEDYLWYFLGKDGTRRRLSGSQAPLDVLDSADELYEFCSPIRSRIQDKFDTSDPRVSIAIVAYNEERQLIPTLLSYTCLDCPDGLAELIVVDNNSTDRTREIIQACGARYVFCEEQGTPFARAAGLEAAADSAEYLWMSDGDVRVVPPVEDPSDIGSKGTVFRTSYDYLEAHPETVGVSSGAVIESAHWSYHLIHELAVLTRRTAPYSCWSGSNQFVRKWALESSGGIDTTVLFGEDQNRHFQLARWAKKHGKHMNSANMDADALGDPVYYSGRRYASLKMVLTHLWDSIRRQYVKSGKHWTETEHKEDVDWRHIR